MKTTKKRQQDSSSSESESENTSSHSSSSGSDSSSGSESDSESSSSGSSGSESDSDDQGQQVRRRWAESDSEDEVKRVVLTQAQKRVQSMREIIVKIKQKIEINDFNALYDLYETLNKELTKNKEYFKKEGIPKMYIYYISHLEQVLKNLPTEDKKKLSTTNNKAFNTLKQKLKKNRVNHEQELAKCEADPKAYYDSDRADSDEEKKDKKNKLKKSKKMSEDSMDSDNKEIDSSSSSSDNEEVTEAERQYRDDMRKFRQSSDPMIRRKYWLKKSVLYPHLVSEDSEVDTEEEEKRKEERRERKKRELEEKKRQQETSEFNIIKIEVKEIDVNNKESVNKQLREIVEYRNKVKTLDKQNFLDILLKYFFSFQVTDQRTLEVIMILLPLSSDLAKSISPNYMPRNIWTSVLGALDTLLDILKNKSTDYDQVNTYNPMYEKQGDKEVEIQFIDDEAEKAHRFHSEEYIKNTLAVFLNTLDIELNKALKFVEYTTPEYDNRVNDLYDLLKLLKKSQKYYEQTGNTHSASSIAYSRLSNLYYFNDSQLLKLREAAKAQNKDIKGEFYEIENSENLIKDLSRTIYKNDPSNKLNIYNTVLFQMYHHAIHDRVEQAKNLLLSSHVNEIVNNVESPFFVLYARFLVQQGLAHFRLGNSKLANIYLKQLFIQKKPLNGLLGQQVGKFVSPADKKKSLPYHTHINLELVESVNYIVGMLLDTPTVLQFEKKSPQQIKLKSINFKQFYESYSKDKNQQSEIAPPKLSGKHLFNGPRELNTDFIYDAFRQISKGNWECAYNNLLKLNIWGDINEAEQVQQILKQNVKECAFKCYLIFYKTTFESLSLNLLAEKFEISINNVKTLASKLIVKKKIVASLTGEENNNYLVYEQLQKTKQQYMADKLLDKIAAIVDQNEQILFQGNKKDEKEINQQQQKYKNYSNYRKKQEIVIAADNQHQRVKKTHHKKKKF